MIDGFLTWDKNTEDHSRSLIVSLERAKKIGLTVNLGKCKFNADKLIYLGHKITRIEPDDAKMIGIMEMPEPSDKKGIQRVLGLIDCVTKI